MVQLHEIEYLKNMTTILKFEGVGYITRTLSYTHRQHNHTCYINLLLYIAE